MYPKKPDTRQRAHSKTYQRHICTGTQQYPATPDRKDNRQDIPAVHLQGNSCIRQCQTKRTTHKRTSNRQLTWNVWKTTQRYSPTPDSGSWKSQAKFSTSSRCWYCVRFSVPISIISGGVWSTVTPSVATATLPPALVTIGQRNISSCEI